MEVKKLRDPGILRAKKFRCMWRSPFAPLLNFQLSSSSASRGNFTSPWPQSTMASASTDCKKPLYCKSVNARGKFMLVRTFLTAQGCAASNSGKRGFAFFPLAFALVLALALGAAFADNLAAGAAFAADMAQLWAQHWKHLKKKRNWSRNRSSPHSSLTPGHPRQTFWVNSAFRCAGHWPSLSNVDLVLSQLGKVCMAALSLAPPWHCLLLCLAPLLPFISICNLSPAKCRMKLSNCQLCMSDMSFLWSQICWEARMCHIEYYIKKLLRN